LRGETTLLSSISLRNTLPGPLPSGVFNVGVPHKTLNTLAFGKALRTTYIQSVRESVLAATGKILNCAYCGEQASHIPEEEVSYDHIHPSSASPYFYDRALKYHALNSLLSLLEGLPDLPHDLKASLIERFQRGQKIKLNEFQKLQVFSQERLALSDAQKNPVQASLANGLLACKSCNSTRGNTPIIEYLQGSRYKGDYVEEILNRNTPQSGWEQAPSEVQKNRLAAFSRAYCLMIRSQAQNKMVANWFWSSLPFILFPYKEATVGTDAPIQPYAERVSLLFSLLAKQNAYWTSEPFIRVIENAPSWYQAEKNILLEKIKSLRDEQPNTRRHARQFRYPLPFFKTHLAAGVFPAVHRP
jgi:hypothetical protein